ncbi:MAG: class I poly(R)-hydroxyalkanoic acid synthase [Pseudomonadota bacterium]
MQAHNSEDRSGAYAQAGGALLQNFLSLFPAGSEAGRVWQLLIAGHGADPSRLADLQTGYFQQQMALWGAMLGRESRQAASPVLGPGKGKDEASGDKRFAAHAWRDSGYHDFLRQVYQLNSRFLTDLAETVELDAPAKQRLRFYTRQMIDAMSPANFAATNPEALQLALDTQGESLHTGIRHLIEDVELGRVSMSDESAFEVGRNLAVTAGEVVFENELIQLIQYQPATAKVRKRPLLMVPPCINKFYILDLQPENSFVRYAVEQGNTVFMVSWRNITEETLGGLSWDDYIADGVLKAIEVVRAISKSEEINALGFCVGGTLLSAALAVLRARGEERVASVTLLATMLDFTYPGDIGVFVDEASVAAREAAIGSGGILSGKELAFVFSALRANDLVWSYVVNNYLKGKAPAAFDILYWNADSTNLPGPMYCSYVRNMYLENKLREPGKLAMCGVPVDLGAIRLPTYILATREDHIVPWKTAYLSSRHLKGDTRFVLGASGHVAGVINPPAKNRRSYWASDRLSADADEWLANATEMRGSWWTNWDAWMQGFSGGERAAPKKMGNAKFKPIEPAPGRYVKVRV